MCYVSVHFVYSQKLLEHLRIRNLCWDAVVSKTDKALLGMGMRGQTVSQEVHGQFQVTLGNDGLVK